MKKPVLPIDRSLVDPETGRATDSFWLYLDSVTRNVRNGTGASTTTLGLTFPGTPGKVGAAYRAGLVATGGTTPYTYSISSGTLPAGLALDPATGVISGTPAAATTATFTARVDDGAGGFATASCKITIAAADTAAAPNVASATCTITYERWANATVPVFAGNITLPGSLGTLATIEVYAVSPAGKQIFLQRFTSGFVGGGTLAYSGYDPQILQTGSSQSGWSVEFVCYNADNVPTASPYTVVGLTIAAASITAFSVTDNVAARWSGGTGPVQAVCPNTISCANYPQMVTIWSVSPQYGRIWHKWYEIDAGGTVINIGGKGTDTSIFPPTSGTSEVVRFWAAIGTWGADVDPTTIAGAVYYDVTVAGPAAPGSTDATGWYFTSATPSYGSGPGGASLFGWQIQGKLPITASDSPDKFWAARLCLQTGKYVGGVWTPGGWHPAALSPTDPASIVGDYAGPTAWYQAQDHADNVTGDPATGAIVWSNPNLWPVPSDGYNVHRFALYIVSRRNGGTWQLESSWSAAAGTSTPGTNTYQELTVDGSRSAVTNISILTGSGTVNIGSAVDGVQVIGGANKIEVHQDKVAGYVSGVSAWEIDAAGSAQFNGKFAWDTNGRATKYDSLALVGKALPHIINRYRSTSQTGGTTFTMLVGGSPLNGLFRLSAVLDANITNATRAGVVTLTAAFSKNQGLGVGSCSLLWVSTQNPSAPVGTLTLDASAVGDNQRQIAASSAVFYTDGATASSGVSGLQITLNVTTPFSNASYNVYLILEKLDD